MDWIRAGSMIDERQSSEIGNVKDFFDAIYRLINHAGRFPPGDLIPLVSGKGVYARPSLDSQIPLLRSALTDFYCIDIKIKLKNQSDVPHWFLSFRNGRLVRLDSNVFSVKLSRHSPEKGACTTRRLPSHRKHPAQGTLDGHSTDASVPRAVTN